jgi:hypothetical protein
MISNADTDCDPDIENSSRHIQLAGTAGGPNRSCL